MDAELFTPEELNHARLIVARSKMWTPPIEKLLRQWRRLLNSKKIAHLKAAASNNRKYYILGIPTVILATVVTSGILGTFQGCPIPSQVVNCTSNTLVLVEHANPDSCVVDIYLRLAIGVIGIFSVVMTGLMTFMDYGSAREKHKSAADSYDEIVRSIDIILRTDVTNRGDTVAILQDLQTRMADTEKNSPTLKNKYRFDIGYRVYGGSDGTATEEENRELSEEGDRLTKNRKKSGSKLIPPSPNDLALDRIPSDDPETQRLAGILLDLKDSDERRDEYIEKQNNFDESCCPADKKVMVDFDFEAARPHDVLNDHRVVDPLTRAIEFELRRIDMGKDGSRSRSPRHPFISPRLRSKIDTRRDTKFDPNSARRSGLSASIPSNRAEKQVSAASPGDAGIGVVENSQVHNAQKDDHSDLSKKSRTDENQSAVAHEESSFGSDENV